MSSRGRHAKPRRRSGRVASFVAMSLIAVSVIGVWLTGFAGRLADPAAPTPTGAVPSATTSTAAPTPTPTPTLSLPPDPVPLMAIAGPNLPGEGAWTTVVRNDGVPAVEVTWLRLGTDPGNVANIAWLNQRELRFELRPGTSQPGIPTGVSATPWLPPDQRTGLAATFNGGFRMVDSFGGFMVDKHVIVPLWPKSASAVIYRDGRMDIGAWGSDVHAGSRVQSVRQELYPLLDNGVPGPNLTTNVVLQWGGIAGNSVHTWRSALAVTASGALLYITGPYLAPDDLVRLLDRAGAVRAMELDINPNWVTFAWFGANGVGHRLAPFSQSPARYLSGPSDRDFFVAYLR